MRQRGTSLGAIAMVGTSAIAVLVGVGCGDLGASPTNNGLNSGGGPAGGGPAQCPSTVVPGSIKQILSANCTSCHGAPLLAGAPMPMLTINDLHAPAKSNPRMQVYQLLIPRMTDSVKPMPPEGKLSNAEIQAVNNWVSAGAPECGFTVPSGVGGAGGMGVGGSGVGGSGVGGSGVGGSGVGGSGEGGSGVGGSGEGGSGVGGSGEGGSGVGGEGGSGVGGSGVGGAGGGPENVECFELRAHNGQTPGDTTPFQVGAGPWITSPGQYYENFTFKAPYTKQVTAVSVSPIIDNGAVLHHWLLFQVTRNQASYADGAHSTVLGTHPDSVLVAGWAPGGDKIIQMPPGVGLQMPEPGGRFELEIHYNNPGGAPKLDRSGARVCVTSEPMQNTATVTWLGTENINVPARQTATATGTCHPSNPGRGDIHLIYSIPHMHKIGVHMKTVLNRQGGAPEIIHDKDFKFDEQRLYATPAVIHPGDSLTTTCTFTNTSAATVFFGTVSEAEMCYNFAVAYPAKALHNPGNSIEGALNTCLQ